MTIHMRTVGGTPFWKAAVVFVALSLSAPALSAMQTSIASDQDEDRDTLTMQFAASKAASEARLDQRYAAALRERDRIDRERRAEARRRARAEADLAREWASRATTERVAAERERFHLQQDRFIKPISRNSISCLMNSVGRALNWQYR